MVENIKRKPGMLERKDMRTVRLACDGDPNNEWSKKGDENCGLPPSVIIYPRDVVFAKKREILKILDPLALKIDFSED